MSLLQPYQAYTYSYPHKTAYRPLAAPQTLAQVWQHDQHRLFVYVHVPFCEMRCGFCNLFTTVGAPQTLVSAYLSALSKQAEAYAQALPEATFSRLAFGGGTPTFLEVPELEQIFDLLAELFGVTPFTQPCGIETSPATATPERLHWLAERGVQRVSIGIQSFIEAEVRSVGRAQSNVAVWQALDAIRAAALPVLNIDLIYGLAHQTPQTWLHSLTEAMRWQPEEVFLYPLYVRPLTGIGRKGRTWDDERLELYQLGRDFLLAQGYVQTSMRRFQQASLPLQSEPEYTCQLDGMLGLGCGARSYTKHLHYSSDYAVGASSVRAIIEDYVQRTDFDSVQHGFWLSEDERKRRYILQSLLHHDGLDLSAYQALFGTQAEADFEQLAAFRARGWAEQQQQHVRLTPQGMAYSDAIGPSLYSPAVQRLSEEYQWR